MDSTNFVILASLLARRRRTAERRLWVRGINTRRVEQGYYFNLIAEMRLSDKESFSNFFRMSPDRFDRVLSIVGPHIQKAETFFRSSISASERLCVTLRFLASGDSMVSLAYAFRLGKSTVSAIVREVCSAIWDSLSPIYLPVPNKEGWLEAAEEFEQIWNFPHCIGAIDGKHVVIQAPSGSGSAFFNYKSSFSIVLLATCNANYKFTIVDIGGSGRQSDGGIFRHSAFGKHLQNGSLDIPEASHVSSGFSHNLPYIFVADEAFPLKENILRPFPKRNLNTEKRIFNYRLSRARRVIENTFGIMASQFRIFRKPIIAQVGTAENIIKATVCLHNFLKTEESNLPDLEKIYCPAHLIDIENESGQWQPGRWRNISVAGMQDMSRTCSNNYARRPAEIRNHFTEYFNTVGTVSWQMYTLYKDVCIF